MNHKNDNCILVINTVYPFAAALAAKFIKKNVLYYIHEVRLRNKFMHKIAFYIASRCCDNVIYVSKYLETEISKIIKTKSSIIHNTVSPIFLKLKAKSKTTRDNQQTFNISLIASNKAFKGIYTLIKLAQELQSYHDIRFTMMLNGEMQSVHELKISCAGIQNLTILDSSHDVHDVYKNSSLVLNLSIPDFWVETFGLTILEGFHYGIPALVPNIGGPTEIVDDNENGFHVNATNREEIIEKIIFLYQNKDIYSQFALSARAKAEQFNFLEYEKRLISAIEVTQSI